MIKKSYIGVISLVSLLSFIVMLIVVSNQEIDMPAFYIKLTAGTFIATIIYSALFAIRSFDPTYNRKIFGAYFIAGTVLTLIGFCIVFDVIAFSGSWNYFVAAVVVFIMLSGLVIMDWSITKSLIVKISGILLIVSLGFIAILFITQWTSYLLGIWLDVATYASFIAMAAGILFSRKNRKAVSSSNESAE